MTRPQDAEQEPTPAASQYMRLPASLVAAILMVFLAALLGLGLYANANLRPQGIVVPTAPVAAAALPTQTLAPTALPVGQPTATTAAPNQTVEPTPTPVPQIQATATSEATPIPTPSPPTVTATPRPTVDPELQTEVGDAYQTYWQVRAEALYKLDTTHLPDVMAGEHLADAQHLIDQLRTEGHAIKTSVSHRYAVIEAVEDSAKVADSYVDNSIYVDLDSDAELTNPTGITLSEVYSMSRIDGVWKVVSIERSSQ